MGGAGYSSLSEDTQEKVRRVVRHSTDCKYEDKNAIVFGAALASGLLSANDSGDGENNDDDSDDDSGDD